MKVRQVIRSTILLLGMCTALNAQLLRTPLPGSITYITKDQAFIDIGRKQGAAAGDTVYVYHGEAAIGTALVQQAAGASSSLAPIDSNAISWVIGDQVSLISYQDVNQNQPAQDTIIVQTPQRVFLDSAVYKPLASRQSQGQIDKRQMTLKGYVSTRIDDRGGSGDNEHQTTASLYGQLRFMDLGVPHLDANIYIRGSDAFQEKQTEARIYSVMLEYANPVSPFHIYGGRLYHPMFANVGSVDGLGLTWDMGSRSLALMAGNETPPLGTTPTRTTRKLALMDEERVKLGDLQFGNVLELTDQGLTRSYLMLNANIRPLRSMRFRLNTEFDLDPRDQQADQALLSLTRFRSSFNWRLPLHVGLNLRYSYRENVFDLLDTNRTEFDIAARHSFSGNLSWSASSTLSFLLQSSFRTDKNGRDIFITGLSANHRNFSRYALQGQFGGMYMRSYITQGGRLYATVGQSLTKYIDIDVYDEIFAYKILGDTSFKIRHLPEITLGIKVRDLTRIRLRARLEQEHSETLYRLSLSASRQF